MPKHEAGTPKDVAKRMKMRGLQRLKYYCQVCEKQCRDANGFKNHCESEGHMRAMAEFATNPQKAIDMYSRQFEAGFMSLLERRFGPRPVLANSVYNEYIVDRDHVHMNATMWATLTDFVKYLGRTGQCEIKETEQGWSVTWIQRDTELLARRAAREEARKQEAAEEAKLQARLERLIARSYGADEGLRTHEATALLRDPDSGERVSFSFGRPKKGPASGGGAGAKRPGEPGSDAAPGSGPAPSRESPRGDGAGVGGEDRVRKDQGGDEAGKSEDEEDDADAEEDEEEDEDEDDLGGALGGWGAGGESDPATQRRLMQAMLDDLKERATERASEADRSPSAPTATGIESVASTAIVASATSPSSTALPSASAAPVAESASRKRSRWGDASDADPATSAPVAPAPAASRPPTTAKLVLPVLRSTVPAAPAVPSLATLFSSTPSTTAPALLATAASDPKRARTSHLDLLMTELERKKVTPTIPSASPSYSSSTSSSSSSSSSVSSSTPSSTSSGAWLFPGIVVKVLHKKVGDGAFYLQKGTVVRLEEDGFVGHVRVPRKDDPTRWATLRLDQEDLQTVVPNIGRPVVLLADPHRGCRGTLLAVHTDRFGASIRVDEGPARGTELPLVEYQSFSKLDVEE